jgi:hypothetical protein
MKNFLALILVLLFVPGTIPPTVSAQMKAKTVKENTPAKPSFGNTDGITAQQMKDYLTFIASDELEGRDTPSRGLDIAALYIASHLARWGVKPAGDNGTYFQKFPLGLSKVDINNTKVSLNTQNFTYGEDFLAQLSEGTASGNLVYASHGWVIKSKNINAYQGIDIKDKIVIVTNTLPKGVTFADLKGPQGGDWSNAAVYAQANGAKGVLFLSSFNYLSGWQNNRRNQLEKGLLSFGTNGIQLKIPMVSMSPRMLNLLFQGEKMSGAALYAKMLANEPVEPFDLNPNKKINLSVSFKTESRSTQNVVGVLEGADPVLKNEYIGVGAHYDHDGIKDPINGDAIWNGADDDGSGTVAVMAIAEAFAKGLRPKRSILFIWHAAEEKGLWGSQYYANNPTVPLSSIATVLNIDMIGRSQVPGDENHPVNKGMKKPDEVYVVGSKMMSTELGALSESVNKSFLNMSFNYRYDDPNDPEQLFFRSDHFNYAVKGIPIVFYTDGEHVDYHQPTDTVDKIDFAGMEKITRSIFALGWDLANRPNRVKVDKQLPKTFGGN